VNPTHVELNVNLGVAATVSILKRWSQIQYLTLHWGSDFKWNVTLYESLRCKKNSKIVFCPDLHVLKIVMSGGWSEDAINSWLYAARVIIKSRQKLGLPLWKISAIDIGYGSYQEEHNVTVFDD
jgi:hypothetical protein